ncbi:MAG: alpha/beta hydrolase [Bacteriovoracaceae bacterium]|nr:alpha/beta hydrolase [Bacteriovoracaceae bacterium]
MGRLQGQNFVLRSGATIHAKLSSAFIENKNFDNVILCLSGFGCSHYNFIELEKDLGETFPMVLLDNRGMGESSSVESDYTLEDVVEDALEVMNALDCKSFHLMGISMGGFISQIMTLKSPERILSLTLMCTTSAGDEFIPMPVMTEEMLTGFYALEEPRRTEMAVEATAHPNIKERAFGRFKGIVELRRAHPVRVDQVLKQKRAVDIFLEKRLLLENISTPTLIVTGDADRFVNPKNGEILHNRIPNSQFHTIPETDHLFFLEKPRQLGEIVKNFLSQILSEKEQLSQGVNP